MILISHIFKCIYNQNYIHDENQYLFNEFKIEHNCIYVYHPKGYANSKLTIFYFRINTKNYSRNEKSQH